MAISKGCIAAVRAASGDKLTEGEAFDLLERTQRKLEALEADGAIDGLDARLAQAAREAADEAAIEKALATAKNETESAAAKSLQKSIN